MTRLLLGQLQVFTRIDQFGFLYVLALVGLIVWIRMPDKQPIDGVLLLVAICYLVVVSSGVRRLSWSNYRYWGTTIPMAAYFAAFAAVPLLNLAKRESQGLRIVVRRSAIALAILTPLLIVTCVRGAKVDGVVDRSSLRSFYQFGWIREIREDPRKTIGKVNAKWLGIRSTLANIGAADSQKRADAHEAFAAIDFINAELPDDALVLVHRTPRFFYYSQRKGIACNDPRLIRQPATATPESILWRLRTLGVHYVLVDQDYYFHTSNVMFRFYEQLESQHQHSVIYEDRGTRIYSLTDVERVVGRDLRDAILLR